MENGNDGGMEDGDEDEDETDRRGQQGREGGWYDSRSGERELELRLCCCFVLFCVVLYFCWSCVLRILQPVSREMARVLDSVRSCSCAVSGFFWPWEVPCLLLDSSVEGRETQIERELVIKEPSHWILC